MSDDRVFSPGFDVLTKGFGDFCRHALQVKALVACCDGDRIPDEASFDSYAAYVEIIDTMTFFGFFTDQCIPVS